LAKDPGKSGKRPTMGVLGNRGAKRGEGPVRYHDALEMEISRKELGKGKKSRREGGPRK